MPVPLHPTAIISLLTAFSLCAVSHPLSASHSSKQGVSLSGERHSRGLADSQTEKPDKSMLRDERLGVLVTSSRTRVYLGELLELLSSASKVTLRADDSKGAVSGIEMAAHFKGRPLREVMAALTALFKQPDQKWSWRQEGRAWVLAPDKSMVAAVIQARRRIIDRFSADVMEMRRIAALPNGPRAEAARSRADLFPGGAITPLTDLLGKVPAPKLAAALAGQVVDLGTADLGPEARNALSGGQPATPTQPQIGATIFLAWGPSEATPRVMVRSGGGNATNLCGSRGWETAMLSAEHPGWLNFTSPEIAELRNSLMAGPVPGFVSRNAKARGHRGILSSVAADIPLEVLVDWVEPGPDSFARNQYWASPDPKAALRAFCGAAPRFELAESPAPTLIRLSEAMVHPRLHLTPWPTIKQLRTAIKVDELPTLDTLAVATELDGAQVAALREEFPFLSPALVEDWAQILKFRRSLSRDRQDRLAEPGGVRLRDLDLSSRKVLAGSADPKNFRGVAILEQLGPEACVAMTLEKSRRLAPAPTPGGGSLQETTTLNWRILHDGRVVLRRELTLLPRKALMPE